MQLAAARERPEDRECFRAENVELCLAWLIIFDTPEKSRKKLSILTGGLETNNPTREPLRQCEL
jgi:hypothetical protein